jgi:hypothetical protein
VNNRTHNFLLLALVVLVSLTVCTSTNFTPVAPTPSPTASAPRATPAPTTPSPSPTPSPEPAQPTPITSASGFVTVNQPLANARITSPVTISGTAQVFEGVLQWRIVDTTGRVLGQGKTLAPADGVGAYSVSATFVPPASDTAGLVEVFSISPKDGSIADLVRVPVILAAR